MMMDFHLTEILLTEVLPEGNFFMRKVIQIAGYPIQACIEITGSKSITNRALLLAALSNGVCKISNLLLSDDTRAFAGALHELGVMIQLDESSLTGVVNGENGKFPRKEAVIQCNSAGTAARFLLAACASSKGRYHFSASAQLQNRPMLGLIKILCDQGARINPVNAIKIPFAIEGIDGLNGGEIAIDGSETGQFISALLMVAPFAKSPVVIKAGEVVSHSYVEMTCKMMAEFGVPVMHLANSSFAIPQSKHYIARDYKVEPDLSTASYFFAAAAVTGGRVTIQSIDRKQSKQGDVAFLTILEKMGCQVFENENGLSVLGPAKLHGVSVDMRNFSDTFMTLAAIAPFATTPTLITNIGHTRLQESDRIHVMRTQLEKLGVKVDEGSDWLKIYPSNPHAGVIDAHQDHRIAMAFSIMGLRVAGVAIDGAECVSKTCPSFFELWDKLYHQGVPA